MPHPKTSAERERSIVAAYLGGDSSPVIAERYGISASIVCRILERQGIERRPKKLTSGEHKEVVAAYQEGKSSRQIAAEFGVAASSVVALLRRRGIERRNAGEARRCYALNEAAFDVLTEEAAYWAGFLMADGCVYHPLIGSPIISVGLAGKDADHVAAFAQFLGTDKPVTVSLVKTSPGATNASIQVSSRHLAARLAELGMAGYSLERFPAPVLDTNRHFWRGVVDGDGSIAWKSNGLPFVALCGGLRITNQFLEFARVVYPETQANVQPQKNIYRVRFSGIGAMILIRCLYEGCSVALDRKLEVAMKILSSDWKPQTQHWTGRCSEEGCTRPDYIHGRCRRHHSALDRRLRGIRVRPSHAGTACGYPGCGRVVKDLGLCIRHYQVAYNRQRFCVEIPCGYCGVILRRPPSQLAASKSGLQFCSTDHANKHRGDRCKTQSSIPIVGPLAFAPDAADFTDCVELPCAA